MKAVFMATGVGSRLSHVVRKPKCVLDVVGLLLLRHTMDMLLARGIGLAVVLGREREQMKKRQKNCLFYLSFSLVHNMFDKVIHYHHYTS